MESEACSRRCARAACCRRDARCRDALGGPGLGLPARPRGAPARRRDGDCAARQLRPARRLRRGRAPLRGALRAARGARSRSSVRGGPRAPATCRPGRATRATPPRRGWREEADGADRHRPHRRRPGRDDPLPPRLLAQPPRPARDAARDGKLVRPLLGFTRAQTTAYCEERGLAWRDDPTNAEPPTPATASARAAAGAGRRSTRPPRRTCCARRSCCATRPRCWTRWSTPSSTALTARARGTIALERLAELPPALRRLVVQRLADRGRRPPGRRRRQPRRRGRRPAPHRHRDARPRRWRPRRRRARRPARRAVTSRPSGECSRLEAEGGIKS